MGLPSLTTPRRTTTPRTMMKTTATTMTTTACWQTLPVESHRAIARQFTRFVTGGDIGGMAWDAFLPSLSSIAARCAGRLVSHHWAQLDECLSETWAEARSPKELEGLSVHRLVQTGLAASWPVRAPKALWFSWLWPLGQVDTGRTSLMVVSHDGPGIVITVDQSCLRPLQLNVCFWRRPSC